MRLYHGTNTDFSEIDLAKSFPLKDFGQGFYLTTIREQAERMAKRKHEALGGKAIVQEYEFDEISLHKGDLKVLIFEGTTLNGQHLSLIIGQETKTISMIMISLSDL